jgi:hypothetical protein
MPHHDHDGGPEERPSERRQRIKSERDPKRTHKSSRSSRPKIIDPETGELDTGGGKIKRLILNQSCPWRM